MSRYWLTLYTANEETVGSTVGNEVVKDEGLDECLDEGEKDKNELGVEDDGNILLTEKVENILGVVEDDNELGVKEDDFDEGLKKALKGDNELGVTEDSFDEGIDWGLQIEGETDDGGEEIGKELGVNEVGYNEGVEELLKVNEMGIEKLEEKPGTAEVGNVLGIRRETEVGCTKSDGKIVAFIVGKEVGLTEPKFVGLMLGISVG